MAKPKPRWVKTHRKSAGWIDLVVGKRVIDEPELNKRVPQITVKDIDAVLSRNNLTGNAETLLQELRKGDFPERKKREAYVVFYADMESDPGPDEVETRFYMAETNPAAEKKFLKDIGEAEEFAMYSIWPVESLIEHLRNGAREVTSASTPD